MDMRIDKTPAGESTPLDTLLDALAERIAAHLQAPPKELWSAKDLAERYSVGQSSIRQKMRAGEFGELVHIDSRTRLVTWAGVQMYERTHCRSFEPRTYAPRRKAQRRENPGPI